MRFRIAISMLLTLLLVSCASIPTPTTDEAVFDLKEYFDGPSEAWGVVENRSGEIIRRFHVDLMGTWQGNRGELYEKFTYADGSEEERTWYLNKLDDGRYTGAASDVVGEAIGYSYGASFRWSYVLEVPYRDGTIKVRLDDRLHQVDEKTVINRADMKKFGLTVGRILLVFKKP